MAIDTLRVAKRLRKAGLIDPPAETWRVAVDAAPRFGIALAGVELRDPPNDYEAAFQQVAPEYRGVMYLPTSSVFVRDAQRLAAFALRHRVISCFSDWPMVDAGGLMSYTADRVAAARRAAELADRIARGVKPEDLPVEQSARFVLKINLKTAQALGLTFPQAILARADEVIE